MLVGASLFVLALAENGRVPVDNPATHLELTMIHEVMVLDHSGPELAAMQYAAAIKMTLYAGLIAALLNPIDPAANPLGAILSVALALRYSFDRPGEADMLEATVTAVVAGGTRTADIALGGRAPVGTVAMGDAVIAALDAQR